MAHTAPARPGRGRRYNGAPTVTQPSWERHARCAGLGTDFFFSEDEEDRRYAKSVCHRCPVEADCLAHALQRGERGGIWGGRTERERLDLLTGRTPTAAGADEPDEDDEDGTAAA